MSDSPAIDIAYSCARKSRYDSEAFARTVALDCWYERRVWLRPYACEVCGGWHLTKQNAAAVMKPGWRMPEKSKRAKASERRRAKRRRR